MPVSLFLSGLLIGAVLLIGVWAGICISEDADIADGELEALLFAESLERETRRWE
jgi:hypothetical protein